MLILKQKLDYELKRHISVPTCHQLLTFQVGVFAISFIEGPRCFGFCKNAWQG
jgi:hypothetical protein